MNMNKKLRALCFAVMACSAVSSGAKELSWAENLMKQDAKFEAKVGPLAKKIEASNPKLMTDLKQFNLGARDVAKTLGNAATDLVFVPNSPCRAVETRDIVGAFAANQTRNYDVAGGAADFTDQVTGANGATPCAAMALDGAGNVPKAVLVGISVIGQSNAGFLNAWAFNDTEPVVATMVFDGGGLASTFAVVPVCQSGTSFCGDDISLKVAGATAHIAVDVYGYFARPEATALQCVDVYNATATNVSAGADGCVDPPACNLGYSFISPLFDNSGFGGLVISQLNGPGAAGTAICGRNTSASAKSYIAGARCCRVPGR